MDDAETGTDDSAQEVMTSSVIVSCVAGSGKELGGDECEPDRASGRRLAAGGRRGRGSRGGWVGAGWLEIALGWTMGSMTCNG